MQRRLHLVELLTLIKNLISSLDREQLFQLQNRNYKIVRFVAIKIIKCATKSAAVTINNVMIQTRLANASTKFFFAKNEKRLLFIQKASILRSMRIADHVILVVVVCWWWQYFGGSIFGGRTLFFGVRTMNFGVSKFNFGYDPRYEKNYFWCQ